MRPSNGPQRAAEAAEKFGFPVALKVADHDIVHKTDRGLVRVGLASAARWPPLSALRQELGRDEVPVLVQPVVEGVEIALGVARDPGFGPLVMVAAGGVATNSKSPSALFLYLVQSLNLLSPGEEIGKFFIPTAAREMVGQELPAIARRGRQRGPIIRGHREAITLPHHRAPAVDEATMQGAQVGTVSLTKSC